MKSQFDQTYTIKGTPVPNTLIEMMDETSISEDISKKLQTDGYLFLRNVYDPTEVIEARNKVLNHLYEVGEVQDPYQDAIFSGSSKRRNLYPNTHKLGEFWKNVSEVKELRSIINGSEINRVMTKIFDAEVTHFSFAWLRAVVQGKASPVHIDHQYMNRGTDQLLTCWTTLGKIAKNEGALYVLKRSHTWSDIKNKFLGHDIDAFPNIPGHIQEHPLDLAVRKKTVFLSNIFNPGDCIIFGMFAVHGSFDNNNQSGKIRLSCDTRFQPKNESMDPRFIGLNPEAHKGLGYGCLSSSLPLTETALLK